MKLQDENAEAAYWPKELQVFATTAKEYVQLL